MIIEILLIHVKNSPINFVSTKTLFKIELMSDKNRMRHNSKWMKFDWAEKFYKIRFSDFDLRIFHFLSYRARRWLKKSFIDHTSISNHHLGDVGPHRRDFRGIKLTPHAEWVDLDPPSRIGLNYDIHSFKIDLLMFDARRNFHQDTHIEKSDVDCPVQKQGSNCGPRIRRTQNWHR